MTEFVLDEVSLAGFRAYLQPHRFCLSRRNQPLSLALFADNGRGKSSLVDGLEFYRSVSGSLERLGQRQSTTLGGIQALEHVKAADAGVKACVRVQFRLGTETIAGERFVDGEAPEAAKRLSALTPVDPIIRGHQLRKFVEGQTEADRYAEVARWFGLQPLVDLQDNLAKLKRDYKKAATSTQKRDWATANLSAATSGAVPVWDDAKVLAWANAQILAPIRAGLVLADLSSTDPAMTELLALKEAEDTQLGLPRLKMLLDGLEDILGKRAPQEDGAVLPTALPRLGGKANSLKDTVLRLEDALKAVEKARETSSQALLSDVWNAAVKVLETPAGAEDFCPVCETKLSETSAGSRVALATNRLRKKASV